jgi:hypothetical protein
MYAILLLDLWCRFLAAENGSAGNFRAIIIPKTCEANWMLSRELLVSLSLCVGILENRAPPVMWCFSDLGVLELCFM